MIARITTLVGTHCGTITRRGLFWLTVRDLTGDTVTIRRSAVVAIESGPTIQAAWERAQARAEEPRRKPALDEREMAEILRRAGEVSGE